MKTFLTTMSDKKTATMLKVAIINTLDAVGMEVLVVPPDGRAERRALYGFGALSSTRVLQRGARCLTVQPH
jgi:hypothetical protein